MVRACTLSAIYIVEPRSDPEANRLPKQRKLSRERRGAWKRGVYIYKYYMYSRVGMSVYIYIYDYVFWTWIYIYIQIYR